MHPLVCPLCRIALPTVDDVCPRDGRLGVEASWLPVPPTLSQRFRVLEPFAHGDTGSLYLADEPETGRRGLLKLLAPQFREQLADRQRLRRELAKQSTLQRTTLIAPLASGESDGTTWIFREWLDGVSLEVRLSREGALQQTESLAIAAQIATALDELHRGGLLHRDVKPGHIFLQPSPHGIPRAYLLDAGLAVVLQTASGTRLQGTPGYLAPEQLLGGLVSFRSDLYSLGCVLYRMLTGRSAFDGENREEILASQRRGEHPPIPAALPNGIGALLQSILSRDPQERPFSAQKLRRTLEPFLPDGALMEKLPTSTFETVPEPRPSTAPQPSGTLRPPPPPSSRPGSLQGAAGGTLRPPGRPPTAGNPSARPKAPPPDPTQQLDVEQLMDFEELLTPEPKRAATSVPPPMPARAVSAPRKPAPPSDKTQPIRLDQILAVAAARKSNEPPAAPEPPHAPEPELPAQGARSPEHEPLFGRSQREHDYDQPSQELGLDASLAHGSARSDRGASDDDQYDEDATTVLPERSAAGTASARDAAAESDAQASAHHDGEREHAYHAAQPASSPLRSGAQPRASTRSAAAVAKATLMGIGGDPSEPPPALEPLTGPAVETSRSERDHPTERILAHGADDASDASHGVTGSMAASALTTLGGVRADSRRLLMYASAALVGLGVLGVGASALMSGDDEPAHAAVAPPPLPAAVAAARPAQPTNKEVALAEAPRPVTQPLPAEPSAAPAANAIAVEQLAPGASAPDTQALEIEAAKAKLTEIAAKESARAKELSDAKQPVAPKTPIAAKESSGAEDAVAASDSSGVKESASERHRRNRAARAAARAEATKSPVKESTSKESPKESSTDKVAPFAAAREEARSHYAAKRYKEAEAAYERASRLDPSHAGTFAGLGAARLQIGDPKGALQAYQRAVQLSPDTSGFHAALGRAYLANGDKSRAAAAYKRALTLDPKNDAAKSALRQLGG
jgi:serine/threonine-protein kinase